MTADNQRNRERVLHIEQSFRDLTRRMLAFLFIFGACIDVLLALLDYVVTPENFVRFLAYRLCTAALTMGLFFLLRYHRSAAYQNFLILCGSVLTAMMVELMILSFGGHTSPYYAGMIIIAVFIFGFLPISARMTALVSGSVLAVYILPLLVFDTITDTRVFINNVSFLTAAALGSILWRYYNQKLLTSKFSLEFELSRDKEQLAKYSTQLENLVEERTRELNQSEFMLRSLFENANEGIIITDAKGIVLDLNQKSCDIHGFDKAALVGTNIELLEADEGRQALPARRERILAGEALTYETQHYRRDGSRITLDVSAKAISVDGRTLIQSFYRDMTEKKRLQEQLFQSQKMESIGVLVGGIAHDFNNMLGAILGHAELLHDSDLLGEKERQRITIIESSARRATHLIARLLSFARQKTIEKQIVNVNSVIKDTIDLLERIIAKKNISVITELDYGIPPVEGDANQLEQVVMNLMVNAMDAMPGGGSITVRSSRQVLSSGAENVHPLLPPGKYTVLRIADTGTGIPEEIRQRIFDPFFTTKESGKGTGLGLSMVYGIVKEHRGIINVTSEVGKGSVFEIFLPASDHIMNDVQRILDGASAGSETVLVVDDEEYMLSFMKGVLEQRGYTVIGTENPVNALEIFRKSFRGIDLVITDIIMPLVNGREIASHFRDIKPEIRIIGVSGHDFGTLDPDRREFDALLGKPFDGRSLLGAVRKLLDSAHHRKE
ncbi:MAG: hypothetical protein OHK006_21480 [Thermodesulfovibrionales bacterium]